MSGLTSVLVLVVAMVSMIHAIDYKNPVQTGPEDEIKILPHLNETISFRHYSGYLNGEDEYTFMHYWFVEASEDPANKPLLLWLNGGPGCSSLEGLFSELGPFMLNDEATEVKLREYSWNKLANILFLETPAEVGYSYRVKYRDYFTEGDDTTTLSNYFALKSFYKKFPQYKNNPLFLSGEAYGGVFVSLLGAMLDEDKDFNLKGISIGNGYLDEHKLLESQLYFLYHHNFVGKSFWDQLSTKCCQGKPPARGNCHFDRYGLDDCDLLVQEKIAGATSLQGLNPYNIYGDCPSSNASRISTSKGPRLTRYDVDFALRRMNRFRKSSDAKKPFGIKRRSTEPLCSDGDGLVKYMNDASVREAMHIPEKVSYWDVCTRLSYFDYYITISDGLVPPIKQLINSNRKLTMLVYYGDTDLVCNALGGEWFVDDLGRKVIADYAPWRVDKQVAGWAKHYDGITFATVRGAGQMVPKFRPKEAFEMIKTFLSSGHANVLL